MYVFGPVGRPRTLVIFRLEPRSATAAPRPAGPVPTPTGRLYPMRKLTLLTAATVCVAALASWAVAEPPRDRPGKEGGREGGKAAFIARMMGFDKNKDGKLTKDEVTDER